MDRGIKNERIEWLDLVGGSAVLLVFLQHSMTPIITRVICAFHMPLFFVVSGIAYGISDQVGKNVKNYISIRFIQIIIPWLFWLFIDYFITGTVLLQRGEFSFWPLFYEFLMDIYQGYTFWFLPCLFMADSVFHFLNRTFFVSKNQSYTGIYLILALIFWCLSYIQNSFLSSFIWPFRSDIAIMGVGFLFFGRFLRDELGRLNRLKIKQLSMLICIFSFLGLCLMLLNNRLGYTFMMYKNEYGNYIYAIGAAICFVMSFGLTMYTVRDYIPKKYLLFLRSNSLVLFPIHVIILRILSFIIIREEINKWLYSTVCLAAIHIFGFILAQLVVKYCPVLAGKKVGEHCH